MTAPASPDRSPDPVDGRRGATVGDPSRAYLSGRLAIVEARVRAAVERRRTGDPDPDDRFRGLYVSDAQVDALLGGERRPLLPEPAVETAATRLDELERRADDDERHGADLRLRRLARAFGLDPYDMELLLVALAPDLDPRFEPLYGYLHDDVSRRRASVGLALELCGHGRAEGDARGGGTGRHRFGPAGVLVARRLLLVEDAERPFLTRSLRVPDRVAAHLLGDDAPDQAVEALLVESLGTEVGPVDVLARALAAGANLTYVRARPGTSGHALARAALRRLDMPVLELDLARLGPADEAPDVAAAAAREAGLRGAGLAVGPIEVLAERSAVAVRAFAEVPVPVILVGGRSWDPAWSRQPPLLLEAESASASQRHELWMSSLDGVAPDRFDPAAVTAAFRLDPEQIVRAAQAAARAVAALDRPMTVADVSAAARAQNAAGLDRLARRLQPRVGWDDLVLPSFVEDQLRELTARVRHRETVMGEWGVGHSTGGGTGISALFAGDSGTGKTMSAEVVAGDLGFELYVIDLSTVVDKYIGETEKNLDRIFAEADRVNGVLLFDEADALFGRRSEVKDARDRYANVEVAYLLQRMESFDGLAILTTNLRANVDEAFVRRLDAIVDFPMPEEDDRRRLWTRNLPATVPQEPGIDFDFLARRFKLAGGDIRNICVSGAYLAAASGRPVGMADLIRATEREYRKLGRLMVEAEFGEYLGLVNG